MKRVHVSSLANLFAISFGALLGVSAAQAAVNISDGPTKHMSCSAGVCSPTAKGAVLNVSDLASMLQAADVTVTTGSGAITIEITAGLSWASANRLTLDANCNVSVKAPVTVAGPGGISIVTNDGGAGCDFLFFPGGKVDFWDLSSSLVINGDDYVLVRDIATLALDIQHNHAGRYALASDYDAAADGAYPSAPIQRVLGGTFEGLGHVIRNLTINVSNTLNRFVGLFSQLGTKGTIRDIGLENVQVSVAASSTQYLVGSLVGVSGTDRKGGGAVINSYATGSVTVGRVDLTFVGGLVGFNEYRSSIVRSHSDCAVTADPSSYMPSAGGLTAYNQGSISESYATGTVTGLNAGGLVYENFGPSGDQGAGMIVNSYASGTVQIEGVGQGGGLAVLNTGTISNSHATGDIRAAGPFNVPAGGLVVTNQGSIVNSYATGDVLSAGFGSVTGGLVAKNDYGNISLSFATGSVATEFQGGGLVGSNNGNIANSYALAPVAGGADAAVGGLVGYHTFGAISDAYSTGAVTGGRRIYAGGFIGRAEWDNIVDGYWDGDTSGKRKSAGGTRLSDSELKAGLPAGFDSTIWGQNAGVNNGYPYLLANPPP
jgi:hypothetical protein